jgi:hypothetical protein
MRAQKWGLWLPGAIFISQDLAHKIRKVTHESRKVTHKIDSLLCQRRASHHCLHFLSDIFGGFECDAFSRISKKNFGAQFFWSISWPASIWQSRLFSHSFFTDKIVENLEHWLALRCVSCRCLALLQPGKKGRKKKLDLLLLFM